MNQDQRLVAHIDILGMSTLVEKNFDEAWGILSDLISVRDKISNYGIDFLQFNENISVSEIIKSVTFSDTIILFTKSCSDTELRSMIIAVTEIFHKAMCRCVPVRVGLASGRFLFNFDLSMYAGPALIEAYRAGESAQWLGITLAESIQDKAKKIDIKSGNRDVIIEYPVPVKSGVENCYVVNWPAVVANDLKITPPFSTEQFYQPFDSTFGPFEKLPINVRNKYENTVMFMNEQLSKPL